jgi:hypothetical protein
MATRTVTLHAFCSAKGGVGKSTLAVACAKLLAKAGRKCVLIDADLTGTSLMDGLHLCAPVVTTGQDRHPDLNAPPTGRYLTRRATVEARNNRKFEPWQERPPAPPFLNDILIYGHGAPLEADDMPECRVDALFWKHMVDDGVLYLPSSPLPKDVGIAVGWLHQSEPFTWVRRMTWLLDGMSECLPTLRDVIIDLPPGLLGFAHEILSLCSYLDRGIDLPVGFPPWRDGTIEWRVNPFLITSKDRNDLLVSLEYIASNGSKLPSLLPLLNRYTEGRENELRAAVAEHFTAAIGAPLATKALEKRIDEVARLSEIFERGDVSLDGIDARLQNTLRIGERS